MQLVIVRWTCSSSAIGFVHTRVAVRALILNAVLIKCREHSLIKPFEMEMYGFDVIS